MAVEKRPTGKRSHGIAPDPQGIVKAYVELSAVLLRTIDTHKEGYSERLAWVSSDLCHVICDTLEISWEEYRRFALPEEYSPDAPGVQLEFDFS